ncbi:MAG: TonB family protein [Opitutales bacterium]|nr:TonB family protein [Opitutales bacterium]
MNSLPPLPYCRPCTFFTALVVALALFLCLPLMQLIAVQADEEEEVIEVEPVVFRAPLMPEPLNRGDEPTPSDDFIEDVPEVAPEAPSPQAVDRLWEPFTPPTATGSTTITVPDTGGWGGGEVIDWSALDSVPRAVAQPAPRIPAGDRVNATVTVRLYVDTEGHVVRATVESSTHSAYDHAVLRAVRRWVFEPGMRDGRPVPFTMRQTVNIRW